MKLPISAIIMTLNESLNLEECLASIKDYVDDIIIVDSFSNDNTIEIAKNTLIKFIKIILSIRQNNLFGQLQTQILKMNEY